MVYGLGDERWEMEVVERIDLILSLILILFDLIQSDLL